MSEPNTSSPPASQAGRRIDPADLDLVATRPIDITYLLSGLRADVVGPA